MRISAKADYAVRAAVELATADDRPITAETIAQRQGIPVGFLAKILQELRLAGLVRSQRGPVGGHRLARPAREISVADVLRAVEGPLADVRGTPPEESAYEGAAESLQRVWMALRSNVRAVLESVTVANIAADKLPAKIERLASEPDSRSRR